MRKSKKTTDAAAILHRCYIGSDKKRQASVQQERENIGIAQQIHDLRTEANLSQKELADLVGTSQSVISRLEDADYNGHSLTMLRKIAGVLNQHLQVRFVPNDSAPAHT